MKKLGYVLMRADHFQGNLFPPADTVQVYKGQDAVNKDIWDKANFVRTLKIYHTYEEALEECVRLQTLKDITKVEYFIDSAEIVENLS